MDQSLGEDMLFAQDSFVEFDDRIYPTTRRSWSDLERRTAPPPDAGLITVRDNTNSQRDDEFMDNPLGNIGPETSHQSIGECYHQGSHEGAHKSNKSQLSSIFSTTSHDAGLENPPLSLKYLPSTYTQQMINLNNASHLQKPISVSAQPVRNHDWIIATIEDLFEHMLDVLNAKKGTFTIIMKTRGQVKLCNSNMIASPTRYQNICFPGKTEEEAWRFTVLIQIIELIHDALIHNTVITKRDIYYRHPALFGKQAIVDRVIDNLAYTWNVPRSMLNVTAAAKGLVVGQCQIHRADGTVNDALADREGSLITPIHDDDVISIDRARWILVIEKEATFRSLLFSAFWDDIQNDGIIITGKGYPDIATRSFLRKLSVSKITDSVASPKIYAMVDYDPDGLSILSTYKYGSASLMHETMLQVPQINWVGLKSCHVASRDNPYREIGLMELSGRDRRKSKSMLVRFVCEGWRTHAEWIREIQIMLILNLKAEIQLAETDGKGLPQLLRGEMGLYSA